MSESFDVYVAHDAGDAAAAEALCAALKARACEVAAGVLLAPGDFVDGLADAQRHSRLTAALVGGGAGDHYTLDAVARAVEQVGEGRHTVVPVILPAAQGRAVPYGLKRVVPLVVGPGGMEDVAEVLAARLRVRPPGGEIDAPGVETHELRWGCSVTAGVVVGAVMFGGLVGIWPDTGWNSPDEGGAHLDAGGGPQRGDVALVFTTPDSEIRWLVDAGLPRAARDVARAEDALPSVPRPVRVPDGSQTAVDAGVPTPRLSGIGRCGDDRSCALRGPGAARLRRDDVVCLTDRRTRGPTCVVDAAGPVVKCDRLDRFQRESLGEVSWVLCPE